MTRALRYFKTRLLCDLGTEKLARFCRHPFRFEKPLFSTASGVIKKMPFIISKLEVTEYFLNDVTSG